MDLHSHVNEQIEVQPATEEIDAVWAEQCTLCGDVLEYKSMPGTACATFMENTADAILATTQKEVVADTRLWLCLNQKVTDALQTRQDVSLTLNYTYRGIRYTVTIPAGTNASELLDENGYCGFRYLDSLYNGTTLNE